MKMFMVGGAVRDEILGTPSKDIDFTVVLDQYDDKESFVTNGPQMCHDPFGVMVHLLRGMGFNIFLESPEYLTARAQFPDKSVIVPGTDINFATSSLTADFVLARKESDYKDGRRPDVVEPGTLEDDLARRDFCMNAIAKDSNGNLIDPFNGLQDIENRVISAVGDPFERLSEDALRAVRALRFSVTKGFSIDNELKFAMESASVLDSIVHNISDDRIRAELSKMFRFDTLASVRGLSAYPMLTEAMFSGAVSLDATMKQRGRG